MDMEAYRAGAYLLYVMPCQGVTHFNLGPDIRIHMRPAQHRSCSPGQVLHLEQEHSSPNLSLMRMLIQKL